MEKQALILIDIQNIYFTEGGYHLYQPELAARQAKKVLNSFRAAGLPVIHIKHRFDTGGYREDSEYLNRIYWEVQPEDNETVIEKSCPNAFLCTNLARVLQELGVTNVVIAGMMSHMCVDTTVRACQDYGLQVTVIPDACTTLNLCWKGHELDAALVHMVYMAGLEGAFAKMVPADEMIQLQAESVVSIP